VVDARTMQRRKRAARQRVLQRGAPGHRPGEAPVRELPRAHPTPLEGALERREPCGVWGGQLFVNGAIVAAKRRRGRPPKLPRVEDQLPEVPLPEHLRDVPVVRSA
jgi:hypothetical protein